MPSITRWNGGHLKTEDSIAQIANEHQHYVSEFVMPFLYSKNHVMGIHGVLHSLAYGSIRGFLIGDMVCQYERTTIRRPDVTVYLRTYGGKSGPDSYYDLIAGKVITSFSKDYERFSKIMGNLICVDATEEQSVTSKSILRAFHLHPKLKALL